MFTLNHTHKAWHPGRKRALLTVQVFVHLFLTDFLMSGECEDSGGESYSSPDPNVLFDDTILKELDFSKCSCFVKHGLTYQNPGTKDGRQLTARPLERTDFHKGYLSLLSQLTKVGEYGKEIFDTQFDRMKRTLGGHYIVVIEDPTTTPTSGGNQNGFKGRVVASATLVIEYKFIHSAAVRGRIEDVVVDKDYRGMHLASVLLETHGLLAQALKCYKLTLDCKEGLSEYYAKFGYKNEGQFFLTQRFSD